MGDYLFSMSKILVLILSIRKKKPKTNKTHETKCPHLYIAILVTPLSFSSVDDITTVFLVRQHVEKSVLYVISKKLSSIQL